MNKRNERIPLLLDCAPVARDSVFNLTQGIPFADGQLERGGNVRVVDEDGKAYPTQGIVLATWASDLRYVKWLLIDAQLPGHLSHDSAKLSLEYGPGAEPVPPDDPVRIEEDPENRSQPIKFRNSHLKLTFRRDNADFLAGVHVPTKQGWIDLLRGHPGPHLYMEDGNGEYYTSVNAMAPSVVIEDRGPIRSSICIKGYHTSKDSHRFCPYILRIHMYAGRSDLRIFHTFIFDQHPDHVELGSIGMMFPLDLGDSLRMAFGGEKKPHWARVWNESIFAQQCDREYEVTLDGRSFGQGTRTRGWASLIGTMGSVAVTLRDMWQEYPKGFALNGDGIDIQFWPGSVGKTLRFEIPWKEPVIRAKYEEELLAKLKENPTAGVNFKGFLGTADVPQDSAEGNEQSIIEAKAFAEKYLQDRRVTYGDTSHLGSAMGLAKTHEFWMDFRSEMLADDQIEGWACTIQQPPIALPEPIYACATGALGILHPQDRKSFPEVEKGLEQMFDKLLAGPVKECCLYGMIDYGDLVNCHGRCHGYVYRIFRDVPDVKITDLIGWCNNESFDTNYTLWQYALRTGQRKYWTLAEAHAEHVEDVDTIHAHPTDQKSVGLTHYHNMLHWSAWPSPSHTKIHGWLLHYFLTGNCRALDVARAAVDNILHCQEPCGIVSNREGPIRREFTGPMGSLWDFYQTTWEEKYGDCVRRSLEFFLKTQKKSGLFPYDIFTAGERGDQARVSKETVVNGGVMEPFTCYDAYLITNDPAIKKAILAMADWIVRATKGNKPIILCEFPIPKEIPSALRSFAVHTFWVGWVAHAYFLTGDERYIDPLRQFLNELPEAARKWADMVARTPFHSAGYIARFAAAAMAAVTKSNKRAIGSKR